MDHVVFLLRIVVFLSLLYAIRRPLVKVARVLGKGLLVVAKFLLPIVGGLFKTVGKELLVEGTAAMLGVPLSKGSAGNTNASANSVRKQRLIGSVVRSGSNGVHVYDEGGSMIGNFSLQHGDEIEHYSGEQITVRRGQFLVIFNQIGQQIRTIRAS